MLALKLCSLWLGRLLCVHCFLSVLFSVSPSHGACSLVFRLVLLPSVGACSLVLRVVLSVQALLFCLRLLLPCPRVLLPFR